MKQIAPLRSKVHLLAIKSNPASTLDTESGKTMFRLVHGMHGSGGTAPMASTAYISSSTHGIRNGDSSTLQQEAPHS
jgi:hypothetical protein